LSATFEVSNNGDAYGDATNAKISSDPVAGYIPAYTVLDASFTYQLKSFVSHLEVNSTVIRLLFYQMFYLNLINLCKATFKKKMTELTKC